MRYPIRTQGTPRTYSSFLYLYFCGAAPAVVSMRNTMAAEQIIPKAIRTLPLQETRFRMFENGTYSHVINMFILSKIPMVIRVKSR